MALSLAAFLIVFHFTDTPKVWSDEGVFTETAKNLMAHGVIGLQTEPGVFFSMRNFLLTTSYPVIFPVALSLKIFGTGVWQARLPMIIYMFALVGLFYLFNKKKYDFYPAILSVLMLISFSPFYGNGRSILGEVPGLAFIVLGSLFLLYLEESCFENKKWAMLSGLAFGLSASVKPIYLVGVSFALVVSLFFFFKKIGNKKILSFFGSGFLVPILLWVGIHIPNINSIGSLVEGFLFLSSNHTDSIPLTQTAWINFKRFFTESTPILFLVLSIVVALSFLRPLTFRLFQKKRHFSIAECFIISFVVFNFVGYLPGTGWYNYFFPAQILLYLVFAPAYIYLTDVAKKESLKKIMLILPLFLIVFQFVHLIFWSFTSFTEVRTRNAELEKILSKVDSSKKVLFYQSIEAAVFLKGDNYDQFAAMGNFLIAGDKNLLPLSSPTYDVILTGVRQDNDIALSCYVERPVSQYYFMELKDICKKNNR